MVSSVLIAAAISISPSCSWDNPGHDRYQGSVPAAVSSYQDIPKDVQSRLRSRMEARDYDDVAEISRDKIAGKSEYSDLRQMHFGKNRVCNTVSRSKWTPNAKELGLVYCDGEYCLIVPTICNNVSRVTRVTPATRPQEPSGGGGSAGAGSPYGLPNVPSRFEAAPIVFEPVTFESASVPMVIASPKDDSWDSIPDYSGGSGSIGGGGSCCIPVPPVPGVPEPSTWLLFGLGLGLIRLLKK